MAVAAVDDDALGACRDFLSPLSLQFLPVTFLQTQKVGQLSTLVGKEQNSTEHPGVRNISNQDTRDAPVTLFRVFDRVQRALVGSYVRSTAQLLSVAST